MSPQLKTLIKKDFQNNKYTCFLWLRKTVVSKSKRDSGLLHKQNKYTVLKIICNNKLCFKLRFQGF